MQPAKTQSASNPVETASTVTQSRRDVNTHAARDNTRSKLDDASDDDQELFSYLLDQEPHEVIAFIYPFTLHHCAMLTLAMAHSFKQMAKWKENTVTSECYLALNYRACTMFPVSFTLLSSMHESW